MDNMNSARLVVSGQYVELYEFLSYDCSLVVKRPRIGPKRRRVERSFEDLMNRKELYLRGAMRRLRRLINTNAYGVSCSFMTLTFAENIEDLKYAQQYFFKFIKRLSYYITGKNKNVLKYVGVIEFQRRGAIHFHVIFFDFPYVDASVLGAIWNAGFIRVNLIDGIENLGSYVMKYMTKNFDDPRILTHRAYLCSKGLKRPVVHNDLFKVSGLVSISDMDLLLNKSVYSQFVGDFEYSLFRLKGV